MGTKSEEQKDSASEVPAHSFEKLHRNVGTKLHFLLVCALPPGCPTGEAAVSKKALSTRADTSAFHWMLMAPQISSTKLGTLD
ncbi:hypothetical protein NXF25_012171 [Crotalus adamanteus]|uniref:Uncharacterized protein n=1 Tax=Crotalus adamanteus TaxID=8729 RepID=A0AAW1BJ72_CROAD